MSERSPDRTDLHRARGWAGLSLGSRYPRGRGLRPALEGLEGRALMSYGGSPDLAFGSNGIKPIQISETAFNYDNASAAQPDGKTVIVGASEFLVSDGVYQSNWTVARVTLDGELDTSFGAAGIATPPVAYTSHNSNGVGGLATAEAVAIQPDGKIVVAGNILIGTVGTDVASQAGTMAKVARLNADGSIDSSFGVGGVVTLGTVAAGDALLDYVRAVAILPGGRIAVSGSNLPAEGQDHPAVEMLKEDGSIDPTFGDGGLAAVPQPTGTSTSLIPGLAGFAPLVAQADGKLVLAINADVDTDGDTEIVVTRLDASGAPDSTFGTGGQTIVSPQSLLPIAASVYVESLAIQPDGKLIVGGSIGSSTSELNAHFQFLALRLTAAGALDPSFGIGGADILTGITPNLSTAGAIALQPDDKIVLGDRNHIAFVRLDPDGLPDDTFGTGGTTIVNAPMEDVNSGSVGLTIEADGKILSTQAYLSQILVRLLGQGAVNDFGNTGVTDPAVLITDQSIFAAQFPGGNTGAGEVVQFGMAGAGNSLPAPGAYDGGGISELAVYLPQLGAFAIRPYDGGPDRIIAFGTPGPGASLPAPGDYDHSGKTELAVYLPALNAIAYRPANGEPDKFITFGPASPGTTLPAPADYFGTGQDDAAIYQPSLGRFVVANPVSGRLLGVDFGNDFNNGNAVPAPGDYHGVGHAEPAVYLTNTGRLFFRPESDGNAMFLNLGFPIGDWTIPAPGDYDGSGRTEAAAYDPTTGTLRYLPAGGGPVISEQFGSPGTSIPFSPAASASAGTVGMPGVAAATVPGPAEIPLTSDLLDTLAGTTEKRKARPV